MRRTVYNEYWLGDFNNNICWRSLKQHCFGRMTFNNALQAKTEE
jgi:hypothetical protein